MDFSVNPSIASSFTVSSTPGNILAQTDASWTTQPKQRQPNPVVPEDPHNFYKIFSSNQAPPSSNNFNNSVFGFNSIVNSQNSSNNPPQQKPKVLTFDQFVPQFIKPVDIDNFVDEVFLQKNSWKFCAFFCLINFFFCRLPEFTTAENF